MAHELLMIEKRGFPEVPVYKAETPHAGRVVPERASKNVREVCVRNYRIVYRVLPEAIHVLTVFEGHRLFPREIASESNE